MVLLVAIALGTIPSIRHAALIRIGNMLVVNESTDRADAIVISQDADGAGVLTAADLIARGVADRVAVFSDPPDAVDAEFLKRGVAYYNAAAVSQMQLRSLGISNVELIPRTALGTEDAVSKLVAWCLENRLRKVVFVVSPSAYSDFNPQTWWRVRSTIRTQVVESQKLLFDFVRHPFS